MNLAIILMHRLMTMKVQNYPAHLIPQTLEHFYHWRMENRIPPFLLIRSFFQSPTLSNLPGLPLYYILHLLRLLHLHYVLPLLPLLPESKASMQNAPDLTRSPLRPPTASDSARTTVPGWPRRQPPLLSPANRLPLFLPAHTLSCPSPHRSASTTMRISTTPRPSPPTPSSSSSPPHPAASAGRKPRSPPAPAPALAAGPPPACSSKSCWSSAATTC